MTALIAVLVIGTWLAGASPSLAADTYVGARVDTAGDLRIEPAKGRTIVIKKDHEQVAFDQIAISRDGRSVGWLALHPNCCTSYPIPLQLKVYSKGRSRTFEGSGLPIWQWQFTAGGRQVAFEQETVHGSIGVHYELRDVDSGRLIAQFDPPRGEDGQPPSSPDIPSWVVELDRSR